MLDDQVHQALTALWDVLRKPELSSDAAQALGRAVRRVDGHRVALDATDKQRQLEEGLAELRIAVALMEASSQKANHTQLASVREAMRLLGLGANAAAALAATAAPSNANQRLPRMGAGGAGAARAPSEWSLDERSAARQVELLGDLYRHRAHLLEDPDLRWDTLDAAEARISRAVSALRWISRPALRFVDQSRLESDELTWGFELVAALLQIGDDARINEALACAETDGIGETGALAFTLSALSVPERPETHPQVKALFDRTGYGGLRALLLPWLFERRLVRPADLVALLAGDDDVTAATAADLLAWVAGRDYGPVLFQRGCSAGPGIRGHAFLRAASLLGSAAALEEIRKQMDGGGGVDRRCVDALAALGDARDVPRLTALAGLGDQMAPLAALAAGQLGRERSLDTALASLVSPDSCVQARFWAALHIAASTGHRLGAIYRPDASAKRQETVARAWSGHLSSKGQARVGQAVR